MARPADRDVLLRPAPDPRGYDRRRDVWYTWFFVHAGGSFPVTLVAHATEGSVVDTQSVFAASADASRVDWMYAAAWVVLAVVLLVADRHIWTRTAPAVVTHPDPRPELPDSDASLTTLRRSAR